MNENLNLPSGAQLGTIVADKYRIERILGVGGMGVVVVAHHLLLDKPVAMKFLLPTAMQNAEVVSRFSREARAAAKIKSEHVARVFDVGTLPTGELFLTMEYLEGCDVAEKLQTHGALPVEQAAQFIIEACEALAEAHGLGIVHRDLKPANLFCVRRADGLESIKVLDFGISKVAGVSTAPEHQMTRTNALLGSPLYMSPEQMLSAKDADFRSDIWALGAVLYEMLAGTSPFDGDSLPEIFARISTLPPPLLHSLRSEIPEALEAVVYKCLEKNRDLRYATVAELAVALSPFAPKNCRPLVEHIGRIIQAAGLSVNALKPPPSSRSLDVPARFQTSAAWGRTNAPPSPSSFKVVLALLGGIAIALFGGTIAYFVFQPFGKSPVVANSPVVAVKSVEDLPSFPVIPSVVVVPKDESPKVIFLTPRTDVDTSKLTAVTPTKTKTVVTKTKTNPSKAKTPTVALPSLPASSEVEPKQSAPPKGKGSFLDRQY